MALGRRISTEVQRRYAADQELAAAYGDRLAAASRAERRLRGAQTEHSSAAELHELAAAFDAALLAALRSAEAAERAAMGPNAYAEGDAAIRRKAEIVARKARATARVRPWTDEVDRLRTLREAHKFSFRPGHQMAG